MGRNAQNKQGGPHPTTPDSKAQKKQNHEADFEGGYEVVFELVTEVGGTI
jgi:hypothetical protein